MKKDTAPDVLQTPAITSTAQPAADATPAPAPAAPHQDPATGGSYTRCPVTGELTRNTTPTQE